MGELTFKACFGEHSEPDFEGKAFCAVSAPWDVFASTGEWCAHGVLVLHVLTLQDITLMSVKTSLTLGAMKQQQARQIGLFHVKPRSSCW